MDGAKNYKITFTYLSTTDINIQPPCNTLAILQFGRIVAQTPFFTIKFRSTTDINIQPSCKMTEAINFGLARLHSKSFELGIFESEMIIRYRGGRNPMPSCSRRLAIPRGFDNKKVDVTIVVTAR